MAGLRPPRSAGLRAPALLLASLIGHGAGVGGLLWAAGPTAGGAPTGARGGVAIVASRARAATAPIRLREARKTLVEHARASLRAGALDLGEFILASNALDAEERGRILDVAGARALYRERVVALRARLADQGVREAAPAVFKDLRYYGHPGGLMADALLEGGGSCEQISHLVAASLYDAGRRGQIALRYYGDASSGASHLAATVEEAPADGRGAPVEYDLLTGRKALRSGARFAAPELVEAYARAHGLAPPLPANEGAGTERGATPGGGAEAPAADAPSMTAGYPPNHDRYPGALPMYAARAVEDVQADDPEDDGQPAEAPRPADCASYLRMAVLSPPSIEALPGLYVEPTRVPAPSELTGRAARLRAAEELARSEDPAERLMGLACVAAHGAAVAVDFTLAGESRLAAEAQDKSRRAAEAGRTMIERVSWSGGEWAGLRVRLTERFAGHTWLLLVLPGGDRLVTELVLHAQREDWGQLNALAGLVVYPPTRPSGLSILGRMTRQEQVDVMHEIFHAQDSMRPWAANFRFDEGGAARDDSEFARAYRVFRGLAWRLWEGQRPVEEVLATLSIETQRERLDDAWSGPFIEYYARNLLNLSHLRASGITIVGALRQALGDRHGPELNLLRRRLDYIDAQGRLNAVTLSDAWRL